MLLLKGIHGQISLLTPNSVKLKTCLSVGLIVLNLLICFESLQKRSWGGGAGKAAVHGVTEGQTWLSDFTFTFYFHALEKEMATHSSVLAWRIPGTGEPGGLPSMGSCRVGHDWSDLAAAAAEWLASQFEGHGSHFWQTILWDSHALEHVSLSLSVYHSGGIFPKMRTSQIQKMSFEFQSVLCVPRTMKEKGSIPRQIRKYQNTGD